jgi:hypothetical protein
MECRKAPVEVADYLNKLYLKTCRRYIYSNAGAFDWAKKLLSENPDWARPSKSGLECSGPFTQGVQEMLNESLPNPEHVLYGGCPDENHSWKIREMIGQP